MESMYYYSSQYNKWKNHFSEIEGGDVGMS